MTTNTNMTPLVTREELETSGARFERRCNALASRYTPEQLLEQIRDHWGKARAHFARGVTQLMDVGRRIEALKRRGVYGTYMTSLEALGIGRTSAQHYRDLARFEDELRAEPGFTTMSLNDAKALIVGYKAALRDEDDLDDLGGDGDQKGKPKARGRRQSRVTLARMERHAAHIVQLARELRFEPDLDDRLDHIVNSIQHVRVQLKNGVVDADNDEEQDLA